MEQVANLMKSVIFNFNDFLVFRNVNAIVFVSFPFNKIHRYWQLKNFISCDIVSAYEWSTHIFISFLIVLLYRENCSIRLKPISFTFLSFSPGLKTYLLFISYKFVKGFLAITFLLHVFFELKRSWCVSTLFFI